MRALIEFEMKARWRSMAALCAGTFLLLLVLAGTYSAYGGVKGFGSAFGAGHAPKLFSAIGGSADADIFQPAAFLAFGFTHPLFLVLALAAAVSVGVGAVAGDVENGRAELIYSSPVRRSLIFDARALACLAMQLAVVSAGVIGAEIGRGISADLGGVSAVVPLRVALQLLPLLVFFSAVAFTISASSTSRGQALGLTVAAAAGAYLLNIVALLWSRISFVARIDPFHYFRATAAASSFDVPDAVGLLAVGFAIYLLGRARLSRRDLA